MDLSVGATVVVNVTVSIWGSTTTLEYNVHITRAAPPSSDADLTAISVGGTSVTGFAATTTDYTVNVENSVAQVSVEITTSDGSASVEYSPADAGSGEGHQVNLSVGDNTVTFTVTAEDGTTTKVYALTIIRVGLVPVLSALTVEGSSVPSFDAFEPRYFVDVPNATQRATVVATGRPGTIVAYSPGDADSVAEGHQVDLSVGVTVVVNVTVSIWGTTTTREYNVHITRAAPPGSDADLTAISVGGTSVTNFAAATTDYTHNVENSVDQVSVEITTSDGSASVEYSPADADSVAEGHQVDLVEGDNTVTFSVTAEDGTTTKTYTVTVVRAASGPIQVTAEFSAAEYAAPEGFGAVNITVTLSADPQRTVTIPISVSAAAGTVSADYSLSPSPASVTFNSGDTSATFTVAATDDSDTDPDKSLTLSFGTLPDGVTEGSQATATVALTDNEIRVTSSLVPDGAVIGDEFRLLFVTSGRRVATQTDIAVYDGFVQSAAAAGHDDIQSYSGQFRALGSTEDVDARDNTGTTFTSSDKGVPIYWLNGPQAADHYQDFYDGSWDNRDPGRNEDGDDVDFDQSQGKLVWTGTKADGTASINPLGGANANYGDPARGAGNELLYGGTTTGTTSYRMYGLSFVLHVAPPDAPYVTGVEAVSPPSNGLYFTGDTITLAVTFSEEVSVSGMPTFPLSIGSDTRQAQYQSAASTETRLVFAHVVTDDDDDNKGISNAEVELAVPTGTTITRKNDATVAAYPGSIVWDPDLKVNPIPRLTSIEFTSTPQARADTYGLGEDIEITVTFDIPVTVTGGFTFGFYLGGVQYSSDRREASLTSGDGTTQLVFTYTVVSSDSDSDGVWVGESGNPSDALFDPFKFASDQSITGPLGRNARLTLPRLDEDLNHLVDGTITGTAPMAPAEVRVFAGNGRIDVEWDPPAAGDPPSDYRVYWKKSSDTDFVMSQSADVGEAVTEHAITGLTNDDTYVVRVYTLDSSSQDGPSADSAEVTVGQPKAVRNLTVAGRHNDFRVSWDAPDERGEGFLQDADDNPVLVYRISWEKQGQSSDLAQYQAICSAAGTAKNGWFEITSVPPGGGIPEVVLPQNGDIYSFTVGARFQAGSVVDTNNCLAHTGFGQGVEASATAGRATASDEDHAAVKAALAAVVDARDDDWPWLRTAWDHISGLTVQAADLDRGTEGQTGARCKTTNSDVDLSGCAFADLTIDMDWDLLAEETFDYVAVHELAHAWTLVNNLHNQDTRGPVGRALLYFFGQEYTSDAARMELCAVETLADALSHVVEKVGAGALAYYGDLCFSDRRAVPTDLSKEVALHAMHPSGTDPGGIDTTSSWFTDTYTGAGASAAAWAAVSDIGSMRYRNLVMNMLQDEFGGLCSIKAANGAVFYDDSDVTDPWNEGGCEPDAPAVTAAAGAAAGSIQVSWTAPESGGAPLKGYDVHWKLASAAWPPAGTSFPALEAELEDPAATSYTITGLTAGTEYTVRVRVSNSIGAGEWTADTSVTSGAAAKSDLPPPKNLRAVEEEGAVKLNWDAPDDATVTGYRIERRPADENRRDNHTLVEDTGSSETGYTDESAEKGVEYEYRVSARNEDGAGEASGWVSAAPDEEPVASEDVVAWSAIMTVEWVYQGYGYYSTDAKKAGSLSPASFEVDGTTYTVKMVETQGWWMYIGVDRELPFDFVLELDGVRFASNDASFNSYSYGNIYRWEGTGLSLRDGDAVEVRLLRAIEDETAVNSAATGAPVISGTVQVGETLTADTSGIADEDGLDDAVFGYQWLADNTEVAGATGSTYTLVEADEGKAIKVQVSFTDDAGNDETLTSEATDAVAAATQPNSAATGAPTISGTVQVGETLTADTSGIADADGVDNVTFSYQWLADNTEVAGATGSTYTLADADEGKAITVQVSFTDDGGNEETLTSTATATVEAPPNSPATGAPIISGTAQVGETLTADTSGVADADGLDNAAFTYQWLADDTEVVGATNSTYTLTDADEGKTVTVRVSFTDDGGNDETLTSAATEAVAAATQPNNPSTGAPTISGTAQVGETLTASTLGISDADGLTNATLSYQWLADDADISGATGSTYTLTDSDEGKTVTVRVSFTDDAGNDEVLTSAATDTVSAAPTSNTLATGAPTISGTARVGETLTADTSGIADADGLDNAAFTYQWLGDDADIPGATESTYTLSEAVEGKTVTVRVSFTDDGGNDETLTSAATEAVAGNEETLTSEDVAAWSAIMTVEWVYQGYGYYSTDAKKAGSLSPASFEVDGTTYTVQMVETQGWMYIGTDRELPFGFVLELDGARFASNDASFASYSYGNIYKWERTGLRWRDGDTVEVRLLRAFEDETAVNSAATGAPTISGPVQVGETLTADTSGIADADGLHNATFTYQWLADDADISGATGSTYALSPNPPKDTDGRREESGRGVRELQGK